MQLRGFLERRFMLSRGLEDVKAELCGFSFVELFQLLCEFGVQGLSVVVLGSTPFWFIRSPPFIEPP